MRTTTTLLALAALTLAGSAAPDALQAQDVSLELRGSLTKALGDFGDAATSDAGLGADLIVQASPNLSIYGGYGRDMFGQEGGDDDDNYNSQGFEAGAKLMANREGGILPWVRGGVTLHKLVYEDGGADVESDRNLGFQLGAGVDIPLGEVLTFSPGVRYQNYDAEFAGPFEVLDDNVGVSYLTADFGVHIHFAGLQTN